MGKQGSKEFTLELSLVETWALGRGDVNAIIIRSGRR
jgi:hypothetical protein